MEERGNKTIICSVFFLDIVEYSKKSVSGQISLKERFNAFLSTAIDGVPVNDRIILDTGDGAAISFLGDVEDALRAALSMRSSLLSAEGLIDPPLLVRMGVNLGPVRLVKDINGQPNIVGDGINVAQRVMAFAEPGQILVSRSYYDAASRLSQEYAGMFHYGGSRTDKHVREHEVYAIGYPSDLIPSEESASGQGQNSEQSAVPVALKKIRVQSKIYWDALCVRSGELYVSSREKFMRASNTQKALYSGVALIPLLLLLLLLKIVYKAETPPPSKLAVAVISSTEGLAASAPVVDAHPVKPAVSAQESKLAAQQKAEKKEKALKEKKAKQEKKVAERTKAVGQLSADPAVVSLSVKPWGEVYLDGKMIDVSPPLMYLQVSPGAHVVELKNANFPVYRQSIKIKAGEKMSINYKFAN
jgi:hypothetical protein